MSVILSSQSLPYPIQPRREEQGSPAAAMGNEAFPRNNMRTLASGLQRPQSAITTNQNQKSIPEDRVDDETSHWWLISSTKLVFSMLFVDQIWINYDAGAVPAVLTDLNENLGLSEVELGYLTCLPYIGVIVSSAILSGVFRHRGKEKIILSVSLFTNTIAVLLFWAGVFCKILWLLYVGRFAIGMTQSLACIFMPVWVDAFAPDRHVTTWMALLQGGIVLGICVGYSVTGLMSAKDVAFHWSFVLQASLLLISSVLILFVNNDCLNFHAQHSLLEDVPSPTGPSANTWCDEGKGERHEFVRSMSFSLSGGSFSMHSFQARNSYGIRSGSWRDPIASSIVHPAPGEGRGSLRIRGSDQDFRVSRSLGHHTSLNERLNSNEVDTPANSVAVPIQGFVDNKHEKLTTPVASLEVAAAEEESNSKAEAETWISTSPGCTSLSVNSKDDDTKPKRITKRQAICRLWRNPLYPFIVLAVCVVYFTVTSVQTWTTHYMEKVFYGLVTKFQIVIMFAVVAATGPTLGVVLGGVCVDRLGGYKKKKSLMRTLVACVILGAVAGACCTSAAFFFTPPDCIVTGECSYNSSSMATAPDSMVSWLNHYSSSKAYIPYVFIVLIWLTLLFGGAMVPSLTGLIIAAVEPELRAQASGYSMFFYNLLGFSMGAWLPGQLIGLSGIVWGYRGLAIWSGVGLLVLLIATFRFYSPYKDKTISDDTDIAEILSRPDQVSNPLGVVKSSKYTTSDS